MGHTTVRRRSAVNVVFALAVVLFAFSLGPACTAAASVTVEFGRSIDPAVQNRISTLLQPFLKQSYDSAVVLSLGDTATTRGLIPAAELLALGSEGFLVRARVNASTGALVIAADGNPMRYPTIRPTANIGAHMAAYEVLQRLGFGFLHPLQPLVPTRLDLSAFAGGRFDLAEASPRFAIRGVHYHTEHPLELMEFLNGFDVTGPSVHDEAPSMAGLLHGPDGRRTDKQQQQQPQQPQKQKQQRPEMKTGPVVTPWASMLPEWMRAMEWTVANRQNRWEWILLWELDWDAFAWSDLRRTRVAQIIDVAHAWGVVVGADCGIAITQQHGWPLIVNVTNEADEQRQIERHLNWLLLPSSQGGCGFDFFSTESGFSEFTHPDCGQMLRWMNMTATYTAKLGKEPFIKCHCSQGQHCNDYKDPLTGQPINFNLLPHYAVPELGIYPHTVQFYNWTEPAPTYGNQNFSYMLDFLLFEADRRKTVYHGETAYWVNYDIDLPLFLPIYGAGRLSDMRAIAKSNVLGQINFNSGWEWGYWLNDVITARATWNPRMDEPSEARAMAAILKDVFAAFGPPAVQAQLVQLVLDTIDAQRELLIYGLVDGRHPSTVVKRNGQAYLEGWDTWSELGALVAPTAATQPNKLGLIDVRSLLPTDPDYWSAVEPLLDAMESRFGALVQRYAALVPQVNDVARPFWVELRDAANMTALRAKQVHRLYNYAASYWTRTADYRNEQMAEARRALAAAVEVVAAREAAYRVPVERIAGWRKNPTVYTYGYLWTVHSLYYWWRDLGKSIDDMTWEAYFSPCYLNVINPVNVAFGEGITLNVTQELYRVFEEFGWLRFIGDCLSGPPKEPHYPADLPN